MWKNGLQPARQIKIANAMLCAQGVKNKNHRISAQMLNNFLKFTAGRLLKFESVIV